MWVHLFVDLTAIKLRPTLVRKQGLGRQKVLPVGDCVLQEAVGDDHIDPTNLVKVSNAAYRRATAMRHDLQS